jgi:Putative Flp pilus-assembly TadE/G-like
MIHRLRNDERGQALVISIAFMVCLLGCVALTLDVGSWFREHRQAQATADAAALSGAQSLPDNPSAAFNDATTYGGKNGGGIDPNGITFSTTFTANDTISVTVHRPAPGFFSQVFGISGTTVHATATARAGLPLDARWAAPIVVNKLHPMLSGTGCPCFGPNYTTDLPLGKTGAPGAFALVNLDLNATGTIGASTLGDWILHGFSAYLPLGDYFSDPGAKWNDGPIQSAVTARYGHDLLFPVYDTLISQGSNAEYHIIGWVGFHLLSSVNGGGSSGSIHGYFTRVLWDGIQSAKNPNEPDFGVRTVSLIG